MYETLSKEKIYNGPIFDLAHYQIALPNGKHGRRDVIEHKGAAVIVAVADDGRLVMVRQHRVGASAMLLELPAGKLDLGEEPEKCALRELAEETGYAATKIRPLLGVFPVAAWCTEKHHIFLAEDLKPGEPNPDVDEFVEVELHSVSDLLRMIERGEIVDAKTIVGVLYYSSFVMTKM